MNKLILQIGLLLLLGFGTAVTGEAADNQSAEAAVVRQMVRDWVGAWRAGKFNEYAAYYASDFQGSYTSNAKWREERRKRVDGRSDIRVDLGPLLVQFNLDNPGLARVTFLQSYRSGSWCDIVEKTLGLKKTELGWRVENEDSKTRSRC